MNMANNKRYWTGLDDLHQTEAFQELQGQEFPQHEAIDEALGNEGLTSATTGRRDFLKFMGFSLAAATLAAAVSFGVLVVGGLLARRPRASP